MGTISAPNPFLTTTPASGLSLGSGIKLVEFTFSATYTTNGEALAVPGFTTIDHVQLTPSAIPGAAAGLFSWDSANSKIKAYVATTGVEVAAGVNLSTYKVWALVFGH